MDNSTFLNVISSPITSIVIIILWIASSAFLIKNVDVK